MMLLKNNEIIIIKSCDILFNKNNIIAIVILFFKEFKFLFLDEIWYYLLGRAYIGGRRMRIILV